MEKQTVKPQEATAANADLWTRYFQDQWTNFLNPFGVPAQVPASEFAEGTGARVASFLTLVAAGPIAWIYSANAPSVTTGREDAEEERTPEGAAAA
ncbi:MAG: hypothetical protein M3P30_02740 [Chloroflexota bacterium]|nr:hypothetical protein [Chloroflexota bacterium]